MRTKYSSFCVKYAKILTSIFGSNESQSSKRMLFLRCEDIQAFAMNEPEARNKGKAERALSCKLTGIG